MEENKHHSPAPPPETRLHFLDYWRVIRIRKAIIITVFLITAIIATAVTFILPESYSSTARIKVENEGTIITGMETPAAANFGYDAYFIQTVFEIIQSQIVLSNVINRLDLNDVWGKKYNNGEPLKTMETMEFLKNQISLSPVRNTKLIAITVFSYDKNEAASLANAIAEAYREYRQDTSRAMLNEGLAALEKNYFEESNAIDMMQSNVDNLREELNISDSGSEMTPTPTLSKEQLIKYHDEMLEGEQVYQQQRVQLQSLQSIAETNKDLMRDVIPTMFPDATLSGLLDQLHESERESAKLQVDYTTNQYELARVQALINSLEKQINERVDGIMAGLAAQVDSRKASLDLLNKQLEEAKKADFNEVIKDQPYYDEKRKLEQMIMVHNLLYSKITAQSVDANIPRSTMVEVTDVAQPGRDPVKPNKPLNIILGLVFGLIMGIGLAFFIEYLDTSVKTIDDVERTFQAPVLGVIPQNIGYLIEEGVESKHAEAYRVLRTNLLFSRHDEKLNTIVIVSAGAGEGKSTTTINLATVFAQAGNRVLIVDSDLRRPTLHKLFKVNNNLGLTNYLLKQNTVAEVVQTTAVPGMDFMASGRLPNSSMGVLGSAQMKEMIAELKQRYDFIFFDSPPILGVSDASVLASEVDLVMQVIQYRRYPQPMTIRAKQMIEKVGGNFVGLVLNNINMSQDEGYYYYSGYYHDYYYSQTAGEQEAEAKAEAAAAASPSGDDDDSETGVKQKY